MPAGKKNKKRKLEELDAESFMRDGMESDSDGEIAEAEPESEAEDETVSSATAHKKTLGKLQKQDPEFFEFLQKEDGDLLNFDESDESGDEDRNIHQLPDKLEVASDEDMSAADIDEEEQKPKTKKKLPKQKKTLVTMKMLSQWSASIKKDLSMASLRHLISALKAAVNRAGGEDVNDSKFTVEGSTVFNGIVQSCLSDILPALLKILKLPAPKDPSKPVLPSSSKMWKKVKVDVKSYVTDILKLLEEVAEAGIVNVLLKHIHSMLTFYACFPNLSKTLLKKLIRLWSTGEETTRVLAFLAINRLVGLMKDKMLEFCLKQMYMAYVKNSMFTSPTTLPLINFMQRSLVEILSLDLEMTYQYAFVYIRQLAIHLRNAITIKKKDNYHAVYNWQFIHSLHLWARLISTLYPNSTLDTLIYPLVQIIIGTIKLIPAPRYYPLRFHCIRTLNLISKSTGTFIPILPFLTEVFDLTDFNKHHSGINIKPFNFNCILKLSKNQLHEKGFRDAVIDQLYELTLENVNIHAHTIGFPEMVLPAMLQLRRFTKQCKVANYTKQIKQIVEKISETSATITKRRKVSTLNLSDQNAVDSWEARSKTEGTPISKYYATWRTLRDRELQHDIAGKEQILKSERLPTVERRNVPKRANAAERKEFGALFDYSSDSETDDDETRFLPKPERPVKKQKVSADEESDDYSDFDEDELEQLAGSGSDDEDEGEDESEADEDDSEAEDEDEAAGDSEIEEEDEDLDESETKDIVKDFVFSSDEEDD